MNLDGLEHFKNPAEPDKAVELSEAALSTAQKMV